MTDIQLRQSIRESLGSALKLSSRELYTAVSKNHNGTNHIHFYDTLNTMVDEGELKSEIQDDKRYWSLLRRVAHAR